MKLIIRIKNVFGTDRIYPANETAEKFLRLLGGKTFSESQIKHIRELGYEIEQTQLNIKLLEVLK